MGELIDDPFRAARFILNLRREGITDSDVLSAVESVSRSVFIAPELIDLAYEDCVLPIGCGQTLERPSVVAGMLQALRLNEVSEAHVLIVGAGSGYAMALASQLTSNVVGIERFRRLRDQSMRNLAVLGAGAFNVKHGDGLEGWSERAPFDRILLTGAVEAVPDALLAQLRPDGLCIVPLVRAGVTRLATLNRDGVELRAFVTVDHTALRAGVSKAL